MDIFIVHGRRCMVIVGVFVIVGLVIVGLAIVSSAVEAGLGRVPICWTVGLFKRYRLEEVRPALT